MKTMKTVEDMAREVMAVWDERNCVENISAIIRADRKELLRRVDEMLRKARYDAVGNEQWAIIDALKKEAL